MIKELNNSQQWNDFVTKIADQTFLQSWQWGQVQKQSGEEVMYLGIFNEAQEQIAAALVLIVKAKRGIHYLIPHGPLYSDESEAQEILHEIIKHLKGRAKKDHVVAIRVAPLQIDTPASRDIFSSLGFNPAPIHVHAELTWVLDIDRDEEQLLESMRKTTRHAIRKAGKQGVQVEIDTTSSALERFWPLYQQTKTRHHFTPFAKEFLQSQIKEFSNHDNIFTIIAKYNNQDLASAICIHFGDTVYYYHGASVKTTDNVPAAQLLQWEAIKEAKKRGAKQYNFWGIAPSDQPNHPFAGITIFKKGFGGRAVNYLHAQDLPLSIMYKKLWLIEAWRKKRRGF